MASLNSFLFCSLYDALLEFLFEFCTFEQSFGIILLAVGIGLAFLLLAGALLPGRCSSWLDSFRVWSRTFRRTAELQYSEFIAEWLFVTDLYRMRLWLLWPLFFLFASEL